MAEWDPLRRGEVADLLNSLVGPLLLILLAPVTLQAVEEVEHGLVPAVPRDIDNEVLLAVLDDRIGEHVADVVVTHERPGVLVVLPITVLEPLPECLVADFGELPAVLLGRVGVIEIKRLDERIAFR